MRLTALDVRDLRILERVALEPGLLNLITGQNAAGKTSLLEAIHLLGTGKSFTPIRPDRLIRSGGGPVRVVGRMRTHAQGGETRLGIERSAGGPWHMRLNGRDVLRIADMARELPVVAVHPASHEVLAGVPAERRGLLDWGLFHVEHSFHALWQRYRRAVNQRNALLRREAPDSQVSAWTPELVQTGEGIDELRRAYVDRLSAMVSAMAAEILRGDATVELVYRSGWAEKHTLADAVPSRLSLDRSMRTTTTGPHRAELVVRLNGLDSRQRVSRGQQKLLIYLLRLAQARDLAARTGTQPVVLLDDPAAELDRDHRRRVLQAAIETGAQIFVAAVEPEAIPLPDSARAKMFHVEQGRVREVLQ